MKIEDDYFKNLNWNSLHVEIKMQNLTFGMKQNVSSKMHSVDCVFIIGLFQFSWFFDLFYLPFIAILNIQNDKIYFVFNLLTRSEQELLEKSWTCKFFRYYFWNSSYESNNSAYQMQISESGFSSVEIVQITTG